MKAHNPALVFFLPAWYKNLMKSINIIFFLLTIFLAVSCATGSVVVADNLTAAEMVQRAHEASDRNRYSVSLQYYEAILQRFPHDIEYVITAEYEIAFIHYKQRNYEDSKRGFHRLLARYDAPDSELLPAKFQVLANIVLENIDEIESRRRR